jgi:hypothetical protein
MKTGGCLCGAVRYEIASDPKDFRACHCTMCRKVSGHYWSGFDVAHADFRLTETRGLKWFQSSEIAERGFCGDCGSALFYRPHGGDHLSVAPGSVDGPVGARIVGHIFAAHKGDYYDITDGLPQRAD